MQYERGQLLHENSTPPELVAVNPHFEQLCLGHMELLNGLFFGTSFWRTTHRSW
jgi:hypothetical protein